MVLFNLFRIRFLHTADRFSLKPTEAARSILREEELRKPYEGAKDHFYIADVADGDHLSALVRETCRGLPEPKKRGKRF